jgi:hypothetical protein
MTEPSQATELVVAFDDLPVLCASNLQHAWQVHGTGDQLGTLNRLTGPAVAAAVTTVHTGERVGLSLPLDLPNPPLFGRKALHHEVFAHGRNTWDDRLDNFYPQASTQWDSLRHVRAREDGFYGGWQGDPHSDSDRLGIHHWARRGIIGRGVLVDLVELTDADYDPFEQWAFDVGELEEALRRQGSTLSYGDILCVRVGWMDRYLPLDVAQRRELSARFQEVEARSWAGLAGSEEMSRFLWNGGVAALTCDNPAVEVAPGDTRIGSLHRRLIPCLGFAIGELFDFGALAAACQRHGRYEFLFVSVPLSITGGVGSPGNAVAIF